MYEFKGSKKGSSILGKLKAKVIRLYNADLGFQNSLIGQKRVTRRSVNANSRHDSRSEIRKAIVNFEHKRAMALTEWQKHQHL